MPLSCTILQRVERVEKHDIFKNAYPDPDTEYKRNETMHNGFYLLFYRFSFLSWNTLPHLKRWFHFITWIDDMNVSLDNSESSIAKMGMVLQFHLCVCLLSSFTGLKSALYVLSIFRGKSFPLCTNHWKKVY